MKTKIIIFLIVLALSGLLLTYLPIFRSNIESENPSIRAEQRWNALIKGDFETAYQYQTPGYKDTYSLQTYKSGFGSTVTWKAVSIFSSEMTSDNLAKVKIKLTYMFPGPREDLISTVFAETWLKTGNAWYFTKEK